MQVLQVGKFNPLYHYGGVETVVKTFSLYHQSRSHKITTLVEDFKSTKVHDAELGEFISFSKLKRTFWLFRNFKTFDLVYLHLPNLFLLIPINILRLFFKRPRVVVIYHSDIYKHGFIGKFYQALTTYLMKSVDHIICSSQELIESSFTLRFFKHKTSVVAFTCFESVKVKREASGYILLLARESHYKGIDFALKSLKKSAMKIKVLGSERRNEENFEFLGKVSDSEKWQLIQECEFVLMSSTSRAESYGLSIVEAFSQGKTVVAPSLGTGMNFLLGENERGVLFEPECEDSLLSAIKKLSTDVSYRGKLQQNAFAFYNSELSREKFEKCLTNILGKILPL
ncbi:hypothetical protein A9Q84_10080 [Halobacteriovorax marinus]|uniref:Glycosyl transferase family 1 domain-containing protein n=1 Tax=Halobacteriovorax marinus TaxID=97084 RepID=A0A1Y5FB39_9BACT|nr:hypothetical protein A9Q84_10080 [Halobacteriovorax marinus]